MQQLEAHFSLFSQKFRLLPISLYGVFHPLPSYILIVNFFKPTWLFATFFTYSFYPSTHCTQIRKSSAQLIHAIISNEQFNIGQVILDTMTPLRDSSFKEGTLLFAFLIL